MKQDHPTPMEAKESPSISIVGCGGAGLRGVSRIVTSDQARSELVIADTHSSILRSHVSADISINLGNGRFSTPQPSQSPDLGKQAAHESLADIEDVVDNRQLVILTAGLGGRTGTGATPVLAESASKHGALTVAVVTLPFTAEGQERQRNAKHGLEQLQRFADTILILPNDRILDYQLQLSVQEAYAVSDMLLHHAISTLTSIVDVTNLAHEPFSRLRDFVSETDLAMFGIGEGKRGNMVDTALETTLHCPFLTTPNSTNTRALFHMIGDPTFTSDDAEYVVSTLRSYFDSEVELYWGGSIDDSLNRTLKTRLIVSQDTSIDAFFPDNSSSGSGDIDYIL